MGLFRLTFFPLLAYLPVRACSPVHQLTINDSPDHSGVCHGTWKREPYCQGPPWRSRSWLLQRACIFRDIWEGPNQSRAPRVHLPHRHRKAGTTLLKRPWNSTRPSLNPSRLNRLESRLSMSSGRRSAVSTSTRTLRSRSPRRGRGKSSTCLPTLAMRCQRAGSSIL